MDPIDFITGQDMNHHTHVVWECLLIVHFFRVKHDFALLGMSFSSIMLQMVGETSESIQVIHGYPLVI